MEPGSGCLLALKVKHIFYFPADLADSRRFLNMICVNLRNLRETKKDPVFHEIYLYFRPL